LLQELCLARMRGVITKGNKTGTGQIHYLTIQLKNSCSSLDLCLQTMRRRSEPVDDYVSIPSRIRLAILTS
jgi:hypothetical protein